MMSKEKEYTSSISDEILQELTPEESQKIENKMLLAAKIDDARKAKGWKKKDLAAALNITNQSIITKWLSGTHNFTTDTLWDVQRVLGIELINLDTKPKEQVVTSHFSISKAVRIKEPVDYNHLYYNASIMYLSKHLSSIQGEA